MEMEAVRRLAREIGAELSRPENGTTAAQRLVRRKYSEQLRQETAETVLALASELIHGTPNRWVGYELIRAHEQAFASLGEKELEALGQGIDSWWTVDAFARTLAGEAWMRGQVGDEAIRRWAASSDLWWRRAALVSTVAWNMRSQGGKGDSARTLEVCEMLAGDREDMVVKGLSWALRQLAGFDPAAVQEFLERHADVLAGRVKREVSTKLSTGLKNRRRKGKTDRSPTEGK